jgi:hypothetical protein
MFSSPLPQEHLLQKKKNISITLHRYINMPQQEDPVKMQDMEFQMVFTQMEK